MNLKARANRGKNRLYITITGYAQKKELDKLYTDVRFCVADLKPGFDVISDLSGCNLAHLSGIPTFRKIMNYLFLNGVGEVVRVINGKSVIFKQVLNLSLRTCGYRPIYAHTLLEAEERLEKSIKRNGIRLYVHRLPAAYSANEKTGEGNIVNLSISGCAIESATLPVSAEEEISVKIFFKQQDAVNEFPVQARVVRAEGDTFAAEFKNLDDDSRDRLLKHLVVESEREIRSDV